MIVVGSLAKGIMIPFVLVFVVVYIVFLISEKLCVLWTQIIQPEEEDS
jgi:hypothetical protein